MSLWLNNYLRVTVFTRFVENYLESQKNRFLKTLSTADMKCLVYSVIEREL